ncbi:hypothetical protein ACFPFV_12945 [Salinicoccus siamensis]
MTRNWIQSGSGFFLAFHQIVIKSLSEAINIFIMVLYTSGIL